MMNRLQTLLCCGLLLLGAARPASAQFHTLGADPGGLRWSTVETPTYRLVYPRGLDSLARAYALTLERAATPVGGSIGIRPNAAYGNKMPVILHPWTAYSNGQVTWTPRRMELLTIPDAFPDEVTPWVRQLGIHESRHVAQLQAGAMKPFRWLNVLGGQFIPGGIAAVSFNTLTLPTQQVIDLAVTSGWTPFTGGIFSSLRHEVEQAVVRDVVFMQNETL